MNHHDGRPEASTDRAVLAHAYRDERPLAARRRLYDYQRPQYDLPALVLEHAADRGGTWLDVGCGDGRHLERLRTERPDVRMVGLDLSASLIAVLDRPVVCADAVQLPLLSGSAQVVLAMHMLYHLDDPGEALAEAARVLAPDGLLIASTNSRSDKAELDTWWAQAAGEVLGIDQGPRRVKLSDRFPAEDAVRTVGVHFGEVRMVDLTGVIEVNEPGPVLDHYASYRAWSHQAGVPFEEALGRVSALLHKRLNKGPVRITTRQALLVAGRPHADQRR